MGSTRPPSTNSLLEASLEEAIERLSGAPQTADVKRVLIEARRLRSVLGNWRSIPPTPSVRRDMLAKIVSLSTETGAAVATSVHPPALPREDNLPLARIALRPAPVPGATSVTLPSMKAVRREDVPHPGLDVLRPEDVAWETMEGAPGIEVRALLRATPGGLACAIVRIAPGATVPIRAGDAELAWVLEGTARAGGHEARAGEAIYGGPGTERPPIESEGGCTLLMVLGSS